MASVDDPDRRASRRTTKKIVAPQGVSSTRSDGTLSATLRMLTVRALLRDSRDPAVIATATHVPQALVEVMAELDTPAAPTDSGPTSTPNPPP
jgi:hypothetical protein